MLALALTLISTASDFQPVSAQMSGLYIGVAIHTSDNKEHLFLVDSGSNESYVSSAAVSEHDRTRYRTEFHFDIGPTQVSATAFVVPPTQIPSSIGGLQTEGILGINLLKQIQLEVDYDAHIVRARFGSPLPGAGPDYTPFLMDRDAARFYVVQGQLNGKSVHLCVDTGATALVLDSGKVSVEGLQPLPPSKIHSFTGTSPAPRYLIDGLKLAEHNVPWAVAYTQIWKGQDPDDGTIGTAQFGGSKVIIDFPGSCLYVAHPDPTSDAASRILGMPVRVDADSLMFRDNLTGIFQSSSGAKIVALRSLKSDALLAALKARGADARKTLVDAFTSMRSPGLVTTERNGQRQLLPVQVED